MKKILTLTLLALAGCDSNMSTEAQENILNHQKEQADKKLEQMNKQVDKNVQRLEQVSGVTSDNPML